MRKPPLIVLKLGGSVLVDKDALPKAVHEIYRWRRDGYHVLAVVSALAGVTDELVNNARQISGRAESNAQAALVATGELQSAALLGLYMDRAGLPATVLPPGAVKLLAEGPALDAAPMDVDAEAIQRALRQDGAVIVAGFVAEDAQGRTVLLSRGGSDLTALFLAHRLNADKCRLIKDVAGLFERDPALPGPPPRRYAQAQWSDALANDGAILQHKAVRFAASHGVEFGLCEFNGVAPTQVGGPMTTFARAAETPSRLRVALLGLGVVGAGVFQALRLLAQQVEIVSVIVRDADKRRDIDVPRELLSDDAASLSHSNTDVVIELIGGVDHAADAVRSALNNGVHVVTANKRLIAESGEELHRIAASHNCRLLYSAAVGGVAPIIETLRVMADQPIRSIRAILNGAANFILDRVTEGDAFEEAIRAAQQRGFAEADPARDVEGLDAADKLCVLARELGIHNLKPTQVARDPLSAETIRAALNAKPNGAILRQVATLQCDADAPIAEVRLRPLKPDDALAEIHGERNAAVITTIAGETRLTCGAGAGRWPTTEAVMADILEIMRTEKRKREDEDPAKFNATLEAQRPAVPMRALGC